MVFISSTCNSHATISVTSMNGSRTSTNGPTTEEWLDMYADRKGATVSCLHHRTPLFQSATLQSNSCTCAYSRSAIISPPRCGYSRHLSVRRRTAQK